MDTCQATITGTCKDKMHLSHGYHDVCNQKHSFRSTKHVFFRQLEASLILHLQPAQLQTHITSGSIIHMNKKNDEIIPLRNRILEESQA